MAPVAPGALGAPSGVAERAGDVAEVTLVTGDRVRVVGGEVRALVPAPGREKIGVQRFERDGRVHVVPADAVAAIASEKLDLRLFDVTGLVEAGYDDSRRDSVPLIVTHRDGVAARRATGLRVAEELPAVRSVAASSPKVGAAGVFESLVSDPGVEKVWLDGVRKPSLDRSTAQIGAPSAWRSGYTGAGVKVAVLDSGVDDAHPDLVGRVGARANFTDDADNTDAVGHGTHVAATIASTDERYRGVAPGAEVLDGKVCTTWGCSDSAILAGMQWAVDQGADVVNLSLGGPDAPGVDPVEAAVDALSASSGALFVVSAGNGYADGTVGSPGSADSALTVGAVDRADGLARFSSRGPRPDGGVKPDVTAPGVDVAAAKSSSGVLGTPVDEGHVAMSGTSMAAPHVAGAAALLKQQHPDWTGQRIKAALMGSAVGNPALTPYQQGVGRVDLASAITTTVTAEPASIALGAQEWPHGDDVPVTREITYRNDGSEPVTLDLGVETSAPAGMFTVSPAQLTVPAGGTGTATVTGDSRIGAADGSFSAWVVAGSGPRVPVGLHREAEAYDVTFETIGLDGGPDENSTTVVMGLSNDDFFFIRYESAKTLTLTPGHYSVNTTFHREDFSSNGTVNRPELEVTGAATVTADLRTAPLVDIELPDDPAAEHLYGSPFTYRRHGDRRIAYGASLAGPDIRYGQVGQAPPPGDLTTVFRHEFWVEPADVETHYRLAWVRDGLVAGIERTFTAQDLAEVRTDLGPAPEGVEARHGAYADFEGVSGSMVMYPVTPSGRVVDRVNVESPWHWEYELGRFGEAGVHVTDQRDYRAGQVYQERLGVPVSGPSGRASGTRDGDVISVAAPLFDDSDGNLGDTPHTSARTALHRDGVLVGETAEPGSGVFDVAPGEAEFRLEASYERDEAVAEFGSALSASWTFRSGTTATPVELPLDVVRFAPELDRSGNAPAGAFAVPLEATGAFTTTTVDASFDDGATWTAVPVVDGVATVPNPASGWVSLRVSAEGPDGTFAQTAIRAYRIG
ncbi:MULTISPECIES: S8 family serine peptidase [Actinosynnema]|uniref:S8 family serine peptidase n=1 Tax=Actinosynnema TaxID=40566 RepID=UPI0020A5AB23|nr:S8 family serine peptidase [Actinosynnema pretiosum]